jgi:dethiobiotin synthetase
LLSPISDDDYNADLAREVGYPLVVVAANVLGTINATLQTLLAAKTYCGNLKLAGIVLNCPTAAGEDASTASNAAEIAARCDAPLLAEVDYGSQLDRQVDWWALAEDKSAI